MARMMWRSWRYGCLGTGDDELLSGVQLSDSKPLILVLIRSLDAVP